MYSVPEIAEVKINNHNKKCLIRNQWSILVDKESQL